MAQGSQILFQKRDVAPHQVQRFGPVGMHHEHACGLVVHEGEPDVAQFFGVERKGKAAGAGQARVLDLCRNLLADSLGLRDGCEGERGLRARMRDRGPAVTGCLGTRGRLEPVG